jgi:membrane associated rhomboid family serine protease
VMFIVELLGGNGFIVRWSFIPSEIASGRNLVTLLTAMFMHGGWLHIIGNMIYLWAFGPEIEDAMGRVRYVVIYLLGGLVASLTQVVIDPSSTVPNLGASGAIATVMGAFLIIFPHDKIRTIVFLGWFVTITLIPAVLMIGFWFLIQLFSEVGAMVQKQSGGIAYMAHIGGFVFGMGIARLFRARLRRSR